MKGRYNVGYILNRQAHYRLQFGDRTIIGGFNMANNRRMTYNYKAVHSNLQAYAIRKHNWRALQKQFEFFTESINHKFVEYYANRVMKPL